MRDLRGLEYCFLFWDLRLPHLFSLVRGLAAVRYRRSSVYIPWPQAMKHWYLSRLPMGLFYQHSSWDDLYVSFMISNEKTSKGTMRLNCIGFTPEIIPSFNFLDMDTLPKRRAVENIDAVTATKTFNPDHASTSIAETASAGASSFPSRGALLLCLRLRLVLASPSGFSEASASPLSLWVSAA